MADEQNPNDQPPASSTAPVPQSPAAISPEVQALIDAARSEERSKTESATWAAARRKYEKQPEPPKQQPAGQAAAPQTGMTEEQFEERLAAESSFALGVTQHGLTASQVAVIRQLYKSAKPPDVTSWIAETVAALGITPKPNTTAPSHASTPAAAPTSPPRAAAPAPIATVPGDGPERVLGWTEQQIADFAAKNGGNAANPMHWSNRAAAIKIARLVEAEMASTRLTPRR